jgi:hypothetical protein
MAFDLGLPPSQFRNADIVDRFIKRLEETFDLVLIAERMPESLVLLRYPNANSITSPLHSLRI